MYASIYGNDFVYARERLRNSIVLYKKIPVWVVDITGDGIALIRSLYPHTNKEVQVQDLDISPIPLGFINWGRSTSIGYRTPSRYYKQGLTYDNIWFKGRSVSFETPYFVNTVMNKFPSPSNCIEEIKCGEVDSKAFSRHFAFESNPQKDTLYLSFKGNRVGIVKFGDKGNINYQLDNNHKYLQELLEGAINA